MLRMGFLCSGQIFSRDLFSENWMGREGNGMLWKVKFGQIGESIAGGGRAWISFDF
jgi:hypothetical protein